MKKGENFNHPRRHSKIKVDPIKSLTHMEAIKKLLADKPRDLALFTVGINTALRASELLQITAGMVRNCRPMDRITIGDQRTGRTKQLLLNKACIEAIRRLLASQTYHNSDPLFKGRGNRPLTVPSVNRLVKTWCRATNLVGNFGSHTLRKTFGYHQRVTFNVAISELMVCFSHSTQKQTLEYLGIKPGGAQPIYANEL
jgi:integrase